MPEEQERSEQKTVDFSQRPIQDEPGGATADINDPNYTGSSVSSHNILIPGEEIKTDEGMYTVIRRLGRGGMAEAYLARLKDDYNARDEFVVLKISFPTETAIRAFFDEMAVLRAIAEQPHPNLLRLLSFDTVEKKDEGYPYIILERLFPLGPMVSFDPATAAMIFLDVLEGLIHLHGDLQILHNDIKMANIALRIKPPVVGPGEDPHLMYHQNVGASLGRGSFQAVILDYGSSTPIKSDSNKMMITPDQAAPEYFDEDSQSKRKRDGFGAGLLLYRLLTGRRVGLDLSERKITSVEEMKAVYQRDERLFDPDDILQIRFREDLAPGFKLTREEFLQELRTIVVKATEPDPQARSTPAQLRDELLRRLPFEDMQIFWWEAGAQRKIVRAFVHDVNRNRYTTQLVRLAEGKDMPSESKIMPSPFMPLEPKPTLEGGPGDIDQSNITVVRKTKMGLKTFSKVVLGGLVVAVLLVFIFKESFVFWVCDQALQRGIMGAQVQEILISQGPSVIPKLEERLSGATGPYKIGLIHAVAAMGDPQCAPILIQHGLTLKDEKTRIWVIGKIGASGGLKSVDALMTIYAAEPEGPSRKAILNALREIAAHDYKTRGLVLPKEKSLLTPQDIQIWWDKVRPQGQKKLEDSK